MLEILKDQNGVEFLAFRDSTLSDSSWGFYLDYYSGPRRSWKRLGEGQWEEGYSYEVGMFDRRTRQSCTPEECAILERGWELVQQGKFPTVPKEGPFPYYCSHGAVVWRPEHWAPGIPR